MKTNKIYDFADEAPYRNQEKIKIDEEAHRGMRIKTVEVLDDLDAYHSKGNYLSFEIDDFDEKLLSPQKKRIILDKLHRMIQALDVDPHPHVLMVGLGNDDFSSDALGPETVKRIHANSYLAHTEKKVSCIIPGVMKTTGLESASIIKSLVDQFRFDLVIVFDSLATRNIDRLFKVVQVTDTQIIPGSGINNFRKSLNSDYLGVPLLAVGVSMAITYAAIAERILSHISEAPKLKKEERAQLKKELRNDLILTSKDTELKVKQIGENLSGIFNALFS